MGRLNQIEEAQALLEEGVWHNPEYLAFYANLGSLAELRQDPCEALRYYRHYLKAAPTGASRTTIERRTAALQEHREIKCP